MLEGLFVKFLLIKMIGGFVVPSLAFEITGNQYGIYVIELIWPISEARYLARGERVGIN